MKSLDLILLIVHIGLVIDAGLARVLGRGQLDNQLVSLAHYVINLTFLCEDLVAEGQSTSHSVTPHETTSRVLVFDL